MLPSAMESTGQAGPIAFPCPTNPSRQVEWNGEAFVVNGRAVPVLGYDVSASGWSDELTHLHEQTGGNNHFIDVASRQYALAEVARCARPGAVILEIGVSSGFLLRDMLERLPGHLILGADYTRGTLEALALQLPGVPLVQFDLTRCPLPDAFVDVAVLLNVLEHIGDHEEAIAQLFRIVRPGGAVIIEVPAASALFDVYDRVLMHHRRYDMPELVRLVRSVGFILERQSHLGFFLYPLFYLAKKLNQRRYPVGAAVIEEKLVGDMIATTRKSNKLMGLIMSLERRLQSIVYLPRGIRCLITARRP
jgi:SAM-dependent methyltransferase